jgi:hypothetical protein
LKVLRNLTCLLFITATSCQPREIILSNLEYELIDSLSKIQSESLKVEIAESCTVYRNQVFDNLVDSIKTARLDDIQRLLETK